PGHPLRHPVDLRFVDTAGFLHLVGGPFGEYFFAHLVHAVDAVMDVLRVFPAVLEDVMQEAEQERNVGARADAHVFVGLRRRSREARIDDDHLAAGFLGMQHVQHRYRVRFGRVRADVHGALGVAHVVVRVRHRPVAPRVRDAGDGGGVADARLVVAIVAAPQAHPFAQQVGLLVVVLRRTDDEDRVGPALLLQLEHPGADLAQRRVPADALVLAGRQLHRRLQTVFAAAVLAQRRTLGAVRAQIQRRIENRLLAYPDAVFHDRVDGASDRAMRTYGAPYDGLRPCHLGIGGSRLAYEHQLRAGHADAHTQSGAAQEGPAIHGRDGAANTTCQARDQRRRSGRAGS